MSICVNGRPIKFSAMIPSAWLFIVASLLLVEAAEGSLVLLIDLVATVGNVKKVLAIIQDYCLLTVNGIISF